MRLHRRPDRRRRPRWLLGGIAAVIAAAPVPAANDRSDAALPANAALVAAFERIRATENVPALAGRASIGGRTAAAAVGVRKAGGAEAVTIDDRFHLGSATKAMTATVVALLVDDGHLSWTATMGELFADVPDLHPSLRAVTVEMLLSHRAGLGSELAVDDGRLFARLRAPHLDVGAARRLFVTAMLSAPPATAPGTSFAYANAGYVVAGAIVERIVGAPWEAVVRERLFAPLSMRSCGFGPLGDASSGEADPWAHRATATGFEPVILDNPPALGPAGSVHCSLRDWTTFVTLHADAFDGRPRLVSAASFAKLHTAPAGQDYTYGGWVRTERGWAGGPAFTHDGSNTLNYASVWWAPAKKAVIVAAANAGGTHGRTAVGEAVVALLRDGGLLPLR